MDNAVKLVLFNTDLGWMGIVGSSKGLKKIILPQKSRTKILSQINGSCHRLTDNNLNAFQYLPERIIHYLKGEPLSFFDILDLEDTTNFQQRVWHITRTIPYSKTASYSWISEQLNYDKKASRAVGQALGKNPLPIIIPCHRVISASGGLGGFGGGLELKKFLLKLESKT
jgi:methylated-DNA-[protein]-cysteine S-methyltransferase